MLTIYRASAGAGKTHKLTGEYLMLLFSQPGAYRRILAVTFTNKATDEMKTRIVQELYHLASGRASDYIQLLSSAYSLTERQVREQARKILVAILHDYSAFNISTIDRFFQQTMRAFTREIGLQGGEQRFARLAAAFRREQDRGWRRLEFAARHHVAQPGGL